MVAVLLVLTLTGGTGLSRDWQDLSEPRRSSYHFVRTMLSTPIGLLPPGDALVSTMDSVSMTAVALGLTTVLKFPSVLGTVSATVNTADAFRNPVMVCGIVVVLE